MGRLLLSSSDALWACPGYNTSLMIHCFALVALCCAFDFKWINDLRTIANFTKESFLTTELTFVHMLCTMCNNFLQMLSKLP